VPAATAPAIGAPGLVEPSRSNRQGAEGRSKGQPEREDNIDSVAPLTKRLSDPDDAWSDRWKTAVVGQLDPEACRKELVDKTAFITGAGHIGDAADAFYFLYQVLSNSAKLSSGWEGTGSTLEWGAGQ
jgi:hypothetical protein